MDTNITLPSRDQAWTLLTEYTKNPRLINHAIAVEAVMTQLAHRFGQDPDLFGLVGLLHDFDYETYPEIGQHTIEGGKILATAGFPAIIIRAIQSHVTENNLPRQSVLEKAIYAADELTGFIIAVTMVRPNKSLSEVTPAAVRKKLKDKSFAKGVNRADVTEGAQGLGLEFDELVVFIVNSLKPHAAQLGVSP